MLLALLLCLAFADINARDASGRTPLIVAASNGDTATVARLLNGGADVKLTDTNLGATAFIHAVLTFHQDAANVLLRAGSDINARDKFGRTALHHALDPANVENYAKGNRAVQERMVRYLIARNADVHLESQDALTPLMIVAAAHDWTLLSLLLKAGTKVNARNRNGATALVIALASPGAPGALRETVTLLVENGADVNVRVPSPAFPGGVTPLRLAIESKDKETIEKLKAAGAKF